MGDTAAADKVQVEEVLQKTDAITKDDKIPDGKNGPAEPVTSDVSKEDTVQKKEGSEVASSPATVVNDAAPPPEAASNDTKVSADAPPVDAEKALPADQPVTAESVNSAAEPSSKPSNDAGKNVPPAVIDEAKTPSTDAPTEVRDAESEKSVVTDKSTTESPPATQAAEPEKVTENISPVSAVSKSETEQLSESVKEEKTQGTDTNLKGAGTSTETLVAEAPVESSKLNDEPEEHLDEPAPSANLPSEEEKSFDTNKDAMVNHQPTKEINETNVKDSPQDKSTPADGVPKKDGLPAVEGTTVSDVLQQVRAFANTLNDSDVPTNKPGAFGAKPTAQPESKDPIAGSIPKPEKSTPYSAAPKPVSKPDVFPPAKTIPAQPVSGKPTNATPAPVLQNSVKAAAGKTGTSSAPWLGGAVDQTGAGGAKPGEVQMVGSHEDTAEQVQESQQEYKKQFSDRKKFFKQQMEEQGTIPIKCAPPPATYRQQAPLEPPPATPVVLSQVQVPAQLRTPAFPPPPAAPPAAYVQPAAYVPPATPAPPPLQSKPLVSVQPPSYESFGVPQNNASQQSAFQDGLTAPASQQGLSTGGSSPSLDLPSMSSAGAPTPFQSPATPIPSVPIWSPPGQATSVPGVVGENGPALGFAGAPHFDARRMQHGAAPMPAFASQPQKPAGQPDVYRPAFAQNQAPQSNTQPYEPLQPHGFLPPQPNQNFQPQQQFSQQPAMNGFATKQAPLPDLTDYMGIGPLNKKKTFVDSSFYSERNELYPTFEEQVKLCRDISSSLTSDDNKQSLGARMFTRRRVKSKKWVAENGANGLNGNDQWQSDDETISDSENNKPAGPPPMKYYMSPKGVDDAQSLMRKDPEHLRICDAISPISLSAVAQGLQHTTGRGADLFHKRQQKSEEWVVDEFNVKKAPPAPVVDLTPQNQLKKMLNSPSVLYVKSPWEAALESPIGSCDGAFQSGRLGDQAAAQARTPSPHVGPSPLQQYNQQVPVSASPVQPPADGFSRLPRGWSASPTRPTAKPYEPANDFQALQPPAPAPRPITPVFKPLTPEPVPMFKPSFAPQYSPEPPKPVYQPPQFSPEPPKQIYQPQVPQPVNSVYRAGPPTPLSPVMFETNNGDVQIDADIPYYQPAPQTINRRYSQQFQQDQQYQNQQQGFYGGQPNFFAQSQQPSRHVTWHPETKEVQQWTPQSTSEFRRQYDERHKQWERPPEPMSARVRPRSRSQPPVQFQPGQRRGYAPNASPSYGYNTSPTPKWGSDMNNWRPPPQQSPQQSSFARSPQPAQRNPNSWGSDMNNWRPRAIAPVQQYRPSNSLQQQNRSPNSWGSDMNNWQPRASAPVQQHRPSFSPQQQHRSPNSWGSDMNNWQPRAAAPSQNASSRSRQASVSANRNSWGGDTLSHSWVPTSVQPSQQPQYRPTFPQQPARFAAPQQKQQSYAPAQQQQNYGSFQQPSFSQPQSQQQQQYGSQQQQFSRQQQPQYQQQQQQQQRQPTYPAAQQNWSSGNQNRGVLVSDL